MTKSALTAEQADELLRRLSSDESFRKLFQNDPGAAFAQLPGKPALPTDLPEDCCLTPANLASPKTIAASRQALVERLTGKGAHLPHILEEPAKAGG